MENSRNDINKKYRTKIWILLIIGLIMTFLVLVVNENIKDTIYLLFFVYIIYWDTMFWKTWKEMGKKAGVIVGLVLLLPLGPVWAFLIARNQYKKHNLW